MMVRLKNKLYHKSVIILISWVCLFLLGGVCLAQSNPSGQQKTANQNDLISELNGMSAVGYLPLWRVGLSAQGIELGMPQIETGLMPYTDIRNTAEGWHMYSYHQDIELNLVIVKEPGKCSMSKQWYPYQSRLDIKLAGKLPKTFKGTAMEKGQKPLPPHPNNGDGSILPGCKNEVVYQCLDRFKFALMKRDFQGIVPYLHFPLRINSATGAAFMINNAQEWMKRAGDVLDQNLISTIINCQYDALYQSDDMVGIKGGVLLLKGVNGQPRIVTINKD